MFKEGKSVDEIAGIRGMVRGTIVSHLAELIENKEFEYDFNINDFVKPGRQELIKEAIGSVGADGLSAVKNVLPKEVSYDEIKIVGAFLRRGNQLNKSPF